MRSARLKLYLRRLTKKQTNKMKKLILSLLVVSALALSSCSKDDNNNNNSTVSLEGTWKLTAWNSTTAYDINNDGTANLNILQELNCYNNETVLFSANNVGIATTTSYADIEVEITVGTTDEYTFTIDCIDETEVFPFTWSLSGNTITLNAGTADESVAIMSGNTFSFVVQEGLVVINSENFEVEINQDLTFVYTKQ